MKKTASLLILLSALALAFPGFLTANNPAAQGRTKSIGAKAAYQAQCAKCHADDGKGIASLPDIPNLADAKWQASRTDKVILKAINDGAGIMPGFKEVLSAADARALVRHIRAFAPAKAKAKAKPKGE